MVICYREMRMRTILVILLVLGAAGCGGGRAGAIATGLEQADPEHAGAYRAGLARFTKSLRPLDQVVQRIRQRYAGHAVAYTEPVPGYLLAAAGLRNLAPTSFTRAIENGTEP